jgi:hypothetical protein
VKDDVINIEILTDGTIKFITDPISGPNHRSAEDFLREVGQLAGGAVSKRRRQGKPQVHTHEGVRHAH